MVTQIREHRQCLDSVSKYASTRFDDACIDTTKRDESILDGSIRSWGEQGTTTVSLHHLVATGLKPQTRLAHAQFLHKELKIRFARQVLTLSSLPEDLPSRPGIRDVIGWYNDFAYLLDEAKEPVNPKLENAFVMTCMRILEEHSEVVQAMAIGVQDFMAEKGELYEIVQPEVDHLLREFFMARIGLRFLLQHHIESQWNRAGHSGNLEIQCSPYQVAQRAAENASRVCRAHLGHAPEILINDATPGTFTYVPQHLNYMLTELFKNACRATVERHEEREPSKLPPVRCTIARGEDDLGIKISDEGGGFSRSRAKDIWKFMWSTYKKSPWKDLAKQRGFQRPAGSVVDSCSLTDASCSVSTTRSALKGSSSLQTPVAEGPSHPSGVLAGYGVGLTLSRLHAQYWGGDLNILSLDGVGTDAYIHLSSLGRESDAPYYERIS